jgi:hypothetical protein
MYARLLCIEVKKESKEHVKADVDKLFEDCKSTRLENFGERAGGINSKALRHYEENIPRMGSTAQQKELNALKDELLRELAYSLKNQLRLISEDLLARYQTTIAELK